MGPTAEPSGDVFQCVDPTVQRRAHAKRRQLLYEKTNPWYVFPAPRGPAWAPGGEESEGVTRDDRIVVVASRSASSMISSSILYTDVANNRWFQLNK
jgi:hypothetical protein